MAISYSLSARVGKNTAWKQYLSWSSVMQAVRQVSQALPKTDRDQVNISIAEGTNGTGCWSGKGDGWHLTVCRLPDNTVYVPGVPLLERDPTCPS